MLLPKSYAGSLQVALSTQTTTHTAQQPLNGLRTALKKISRSVNAAFSAVPVEKFEQQTAAAAVSANKAAKAQAKLASGTTKAAKAAKRSVAEFDELDRLQASLAESAGAAAASTTRKSSSTATIKAADAEPPQLSPPALLNQQLQNFWATLQAVLAPAAALWDAAWQQMKTAALTVWQDLLGGVQLTWAEYGQPIVQSAALALENLQGIFTTLWQNVLQPILTNLMQILSTLWSSHLKPLWDDILLLVASVANCLLDLWNNLLAPVAKWIIATFGPAFAEVFNAIADVVGVAVGAIADAIDLAVVVLRGLADFLSAVFRGNWDAAWQAIGNTVNTVWDKMTNAIKTAVNGIIGFINRMISAVVTGINAVINALNGLSFDLPDIFGGGHVGFHISTLTAPQIPYLAQGAVIPANREFLAVLGDQSHGTNVEAPLDTIKQAVAEVMEDLQAGQMAGFEAVVSVLREILSAVYGIELTDEDVGRAVQRWQRKQAIATGGV